MRKRKQLVLSSAKLRSALTNGKDILANIDGRSAPARRFRDLFCLYVADLGGERAGLSEGQLCIAKRAACLTLELERMETSFAETDGASHQQIEIYQRASNSLRRLLESLGIHRGRKARDVTPSLRDYIEHGPSGRSNSIKRVRINRDDDDELEAAE